MPSPRRDKRTLYLIGTARRSASAAGTLHRQGRDVVSGRSAGTPGRHREALATKPTVAAVDDDDESQTTESAL
jgi:hypothetical protein